MCRVVKTFSYNKCCLLRVVAFALLCSSCGGRRGTKSADLSLLQRVDIADVATADTIDFGRVRPGEVLTRSLTLANDSQSPVLIVSTDTSCGCLEMEYPEEPIGAGKVVEVKLTFYSSGYNYFAPRSFYLNTSAANEPKRLVVTATMVQ